MRNLYKRLGLHRTASKEQIQQSIARCSDRSVKADAEAVLLDEKSKALYGQTRNTLESIARMRLGLGLSHKPNWNSQLQSEFVNGEGEMPLRLAGLVGSFGAKHPKQSAKSGNKDEAREWIYGALVLVFVVFIYLAIDSFNQSPASGANDVKPALSLHQLPVFNAPALATPPHGSIQRYHTLTALAPLEIKTSAGENYLIKLVEASSGRPVVELFVHGGHTIEIMMPLGNFTMKYAAGDTWYGRDYYFGPNTSYSKASSVLNFNQDVSGYSGYTVTLYRVANGNMQTQRLSPEEF